MYGNPNMSTPKRAIYGLDASKYPSRMGQPWNEEEVMKLLKSVQKKKSAQEIATEHERTVGSINSYLRKLAADYHFNDNRPMEEIQKYTGLDRDIIEDAIKRRKWQMEQKEDKMEEKKAAKKEIADVSVVAHMAQETEMQQVIALLKDIQGKLSSLLDKVA